MNLSWWWGEMRRAEKLFQRLYYICQRMQMLFGNVHSFSDEQYFCDITQMFSEIMQSFFGEHNTFALECKCFVRSCKVSLGITILFHYNVNANFFWRTQNICSITQLFCKIMQSFFGDHNILHKLLHVLRENAKFLWGSQYFCNRMPMFHEIMQSFFRGKLYFHGRTNVLQEYANFLGGM